MTAWQTIKDASPDRLLRPDRPATANANHEQDAPTGAVVIQDSREQLPWRISAFPVVVEKLDFGDYSVRGFERRFVVERKSLGDLVQSLTRERTRFFKELEMMSRCQFAAILIEAERATVEIGAFRSDVCPSSILSSLDAVMVRFGIHVLWGGDHAGAARRFENLVKMYIRGHEKDANVLGLIGKGGGRNRRGGRRSDRAGLHADGGASFEDGGVR
jgi:ERCC4-type nuclease